MAKLTKQVPDYAFLLYLLPRSVTFNSARMLPLMGDVTTVRAGHGSTAREFVTYTIIMLD